jgi:acetolactate synthase-1/2/3 large subunit
MNGAEVLLRTLCGNGINVCFANPGTSEMHFVAATDRVPEMRCVLGLFEGVATGAADGFGRMLDRPAATLLHLGPGLANGLSNLHNAIRARSPIVNVIGDHATFHRALDAPLTSDIEGTARPFSHWVRTSSGPESIATDTVAAIAAARSSLGQIASLIVPANATWQQVSSPPLIDGQAEQYIVPPHKPDDRVIAAVAAALQSSGTSAIVLGGSALRGRSFDLASRIAAATGAKLLAQTYAARIERGAGRPIVERIPYAVDQAASLLAPYSKIVLIGTKAPVAFFAYPDHRSQLTSPGATIFELAGVTDDAAYALEALADHLGARRTEPITAELARPARPVGAITAEKIGTLLAAVLPENAIVVDESITSGRTYLDATKTAPPHDWLLPTGGSIGFALPLAVGAAIACPDRKVIALESDGSGMYMPQTLWTHARESLNILTIVFANRKYQILRAEMGRMGVQTIGSKASDLLDIERPEIDWQGLSRSLGVRATKVTTMEEFSAKIDTALAEVGPFLIEAVL